MAGEGLSAADDFYELLGVGPEATAKDVVRAYRARALQCHPDKHPGDARAAELFMRITRAKDVLTDDKARAAFDALVRARLAKKRRDSEMNADRRKARRAQGESMAESLAERERAAKRPRGGEDDEDSARKRLEAEIERLRREGALRDEAEKRRAAALAGRSVVRARWDPDSAQDDARWTSDALQKLFERWGAVVGVVVSAKSHSALVSFATRQSAELALKQVAEGGLEVEWAVKQSEEEAQAEASLHRAPDTRNHEDLEAQILARLSQAAKLQKQKKAAAAAASDAPSTADAQAAQQRADNI
eukprot:m51a1_g10128 hypothetical protein (303) ;mRNA; r:87123-88563